MAAACLQAALQGRLHLRHVGLQAGGWGVGGGGVAPLPTSARCSAFDPRAVLPVSRPIQLQAVQLSGLSSLS